MAFAQEFAREHYGNRNNYANDSKRRLASLRREDVSGLGRTLAGQLFKEHDWREVPSQKLPFLSLPNALDIHFYDRRHATQRCLRVVRTINGTIEDVERLFSGRKGNLKRHEPFLSLILPNAFISGGEVADFGVIEHNKEEHEHINLQYATFDPQQSCFGSNYSREHDLIGYTLTTNLSDQPKSPKLRDNMRPLRRSAVLHIIRSVDFSSSVMLTKSKAVNVGYVVEEIGRPGKLCLQVFLTCPAFSNSPEYNNVLWNTALELTQITKFIGNKSNSNVTASESASEIRKVVPLTRSPSRDLDGRDSTCTGMSQSPNRTELSIQNITSYADNTNSCCICFTKFKMLNKKKDCDSCNRPCCKKCLTTFSEPAGAVRGIPKFEKIRRCAHCVSNKQTSRSAFPDANGLSRGHSTASSGDQTVKQDDGASESNDSNLNSGRFRAPLAGNSTYSTPSILQLPRNSLLTAPLHTVEISLRSSEQGTQLEDNQMYGQVPLQELKTLKPDYELDYKWENSYPKAPAPHNMEDELARVQYLFDSLQFDYKHMLSIQEKNSSELPDAAVKALQAASQYDQCTINVIAKTHVHCLVKGKRNSDSIHTFSTNNSTPRSESWSMYALHYDEAFFVSDLSKDARFRAHPMRTENQIVSYLSLPIYSSSSPHTLGTLDFYKYGDVAASTYVSKGWWARIQAMTYTIGKIIESESEDRLGSRNGANSPYTFSSVGSSTVYQQDMDDLDDDSDLLRWQENDGRALTVTRDNMQYKRNPQRTRSERTASKVYGYERKQMTVDDLQATMQCLLRQANQTSQLVYHNIDTRS